MNLPFLTDSPRERFSSVRVKARPEDFIVEEIPLYVPSGRGDHAYFWLEKRGVSTHDAVRQLAEALRLRPNDAGVAGLKDAQAVTRQWISFEHVAPEKAAHLELGPALRVLAVQRHGNKLRMGHLKGNRFLIRLRLLEAAAAASPVPPSPAELTEAARALFAELSRRGVPNFYGPQRFGRGSRNPALGRCLVQGAEAAFCEGLKAAGIGPNRARDRKFRNLMVNAFQAELFNRVLARRLDRFGALLPGDLAWLHRNGAVFKVEDPAKEQPRCDAFEISPSGPLFGPKMPLPEGEQGQLEREVLAGSGVTLEEFGRREAERQPGARRPLRVPFLEAPDVKTDEAGVALGFALPSGSYATVVLRELLGDGPLEEAPGDA
jgi:tRNA pseudouridine13 synthase